MKRWRKWSVGGNINNSDNKSVDAESLQMGYITLLKTDNNNANGGLLRLYRTNNQSALHCPVSTIVYINWSYCPTNIAMVVECEIDNMKI